MTGLKDTKHLAGIKSGLETYEITALEGYRNRPGILEGGYRGYTVRQTLQDRLCKKRS